MQQGRRPPYLGSRVLGRVRVGHSSEGPVGPLHIGGQLIGGGRGGGLAGEALRELCWDSCPGCSHHPPYSCSRQLPPTPTPHGSGHSQSRHHLCPWGPGSPLARPEPVAGSPRVLSAKGRGRGQRDGLGVQVRGGGMVGKDRERDGAKVGGGVGAQGMGPTLTHLLRWGRGQELGSKWAVLVPTRPPAVPGPPHTEPESLGRQGWGVCVWGGPRQAHRQEDRQG